MGTHSNFKSTVEPKPAVSMVPIAQVLANEKILPVYEKGAEMGHKQRGGGGIAWPCVQQVLNINFLCYKELKHQLKLKKHHSPYQKSIRCVFQFYQSFKDPRLHNARGLSLYNAFFIPDRIRRETIQVMDRVSLTLFGGALDFKIQLLFKMTLRPDALC